MFRWQAGFPRFWEPDAESAIALGMNSMSPAEINTEQTEVRSKLRLSRECSVAVLVKQG